MDNNFFANPEWRTAIKYLQEKAQPVNFHGVDVRIMDEEQAAALMTLKHNNSIHIAWDNPRQNLRPQIESMIKHVPPSKISCYMIIGYNSTREQDLERARILKDYGIVIFSAPYRDFKNERTPTQYEKDFARWANNRVLYKSTDFMDFQPRKGFKCSEYFK